MPSLGCALAHPHTSGTVCWHCQTRVVSELDYSILVIGGSQICCHYKIRHWPQPGSLSACVEISPANFVQCDWLSKKSLTQL